MTRGYAFGVFYVKRCHGFAQVIAIRMQFAGNVKAVGVGNDNVVVVEIDFIREQIGIIDVGDGCVLKRCFTVERRIVGKNHDPVFGDGNIGFHHHPGVDAISMIESFEGVVGEFFVSAAVGDQDRARAGFDHEGIVCEIGRAGK